MLVIAYIIHYNNDVRKWIRAFFFLFNWVIYNLINERITQSNNSFLNISSCLFINKLIKQIKNTLNKNK